MDKNKQGNVISYGDDKVVTSQMEIRMSGEYCQHSDACGCSVIIEGVSAKFLGFRAELKGGLRSEQYVSAVRIIRSLELLVQGTDREGRFSQQGVGHQVHEVDDTVQGHFRIVLEEGKVSGSFELGFMYDQCQHSGQCSCVLSAVGVSQNVIRYHGAFAWGTKSEKIKMFLHHASVFLKGLSRLRPRMRHGVRKEGVVLPGEKEFIGRTEYVRYKRATNAFLLWLTQKTGVQTTTPKRIAKAMNQVVILQCRAPREIKEQLEEAIMLRRYVAQQIGSYDESHLHFIQLMERCRKELLTIDSLVSSQRKSPKPEMVLQRLVRTGPEYDGSQSRKLTSGHKMTKNFVAKWSVDGCVHSDECGCVLTVEGISRKTQGFCAEASEGTLSEKYQKVINLMNVWDFNVGEKKELDPVQVKLVSKF